MERTVLSVLRGCHLSRNLVEVKEQTYECVGRGWSSQENRYDSEAHIVLRSNMEAPLEWRGRRFGKMNGEAGKGQIMKTMARTLVVALSEVGATGSC